MSRKKPLIEEMWIGNKPVPAIMEERTLDSLGIKTKYDSVKGAKPLSAKLLTCIPVILRKIEDEEAEKKDGKAKQGSKEEKAEQEEKKNKLVLNREFVRSAVRKTQLKPNDKVKVWVIENEQLDVMDNMAIHMLFREIEPAEFYGETEDLMSSIYGDAEKAKVFSEYFLHRPVAEGSKPKFKDAEAYQLCGDISTSTWAEDKRAAGFSDAGKGRPLILEGEQLDASNIWEACRNTPELSKDDVNSFDWILKTLKREEEGDEKIERLCEFLIRNKSKPPMEIVAKVQKRLEVLGLI